MQFGSDIAPAERFENLQNPFNEEFIQGLLDKRKDRSSIMSFRDRKSSIMAPKKLNKGEALAADLATGPMTPRDRASNMFNLLPQSGNPLRNSITSNQNSDDMNMDHLELRDDDSEGGGDTKDAKLRITGLRASSSQRNGDLTRFSGYRGSQMRMS